jgi:NADH-quinone oxidoreductase subunit M
MLYLLIFTPVVAAILIMLGMRARPTALAAVIFDLVLTLLALAFFDYSGKYAYQYEHSLPVLPDWKLNFSVGLDGLSLMMVLLSAIVSTAAVWFAGKPSKQERGFYACLLFISAGVIGAFSSLDLFFFYAFHELALIPTFLLIGIWGSGNRVAAAWKITIYLATGSFVLLLGLILLYQSLPEAARTFDIRALPAAAATISPAAQRNIFLLLLLGFGVLVSLFPFHSWAPEAYAAAPAPAAMLHAGVLKKFGLYGLIRIAFPLLPLGARYWTTLLIVLLLGNIIYIGLVTIAQKKLDWMLGYSSVMHMGYIFLGLATAGLLGTTGAAILMFAHGISIALLFAIAGEVKQRTGSLDFADLGGLAKMMPFAGLAFGFGAFAAIGLPGFANFAGEIMVFFGSFRTQWQMERFGIFQVATVLALWGVVISAVYMLRAYRRIFMGPPVERAAGASDFGVGLRLPAILLIAATLWIGLAPQTMVRLIEPTLRPLFSDTFRK